MANDAGAILDPYLGDDFVEIIMEEGMIRSNYKNATQSRADGALSAI